MYFVGLYFVASLHKRAALRAPETFDVQDLHVLVDTLCDEVRAHPKAGGGLLHITAESEIDDDATLHVHTTHENRWLLCGNNVL